MRRIVIAAAAAFVMVLFAGCGSHENIKAGSINFTFDCKADVTSPQGNMSYLLDRDGAAETSLQVLSGLSKGLCWYWDGDGFSATYKGLAVKSGECVLPDDSPANIMVRVLSAAEKDGALTASGNGEFAGSTDDGTDFTLTADSETCNINTVSVPDYGIKVKFYDYKQ